MLTVEIHGLGREDAAIIRNKIFEIIQNITVVDSKIFFVEIFNTDVVGIDNKIKPQLRLVSNYSQMENNLIVAKLTVLSFPIHIISTKVYEGE